MASVTREACQEPGTVPSMYECSLTTIFIIKFYIQATALSKEQFKTEGSIYILRISQGLGRSSLAKSLPSMYKTVGLILRTTKIILMALRIELKKKIN